MLRNVVTLLMAVMFLPALSIGKGSFHDGGSGQGQSGAANPDVPVNTVKNLIRVPLIKQGTGYTCGVAVLISIFQFYDTSEFFVEDDLAKDLHADPTDGVHTKAIVKVARAYGFETKRMRNMNITELKGFIDAGIPVIVLIQAWPDDEEQTNDWENDWDDGHFAIVNGYDEGNIYLMDPSTTGTYAYIPTEEFLRRWHDVDNHERVYNFGMIVHKDRPQFSDQVIRPLN